MTHYIDKGGFLGSTERLQPENNTNKIVRYGTRKEKN